MPLNDIEDLTWLIVCYLIYSKTCLIRDHSKIDKTKILVTNGSLMQVKSIVDPGL